MMRRLSLEERDRLRRRAEGVAKLHSANVVLSPGEVLALLDAAEPRLPPLPGDRGRLMAALNLGRGGLPE